MYTKPNNELNMGLWVCLKLDPEDENEQHREPSAEDGSLFAIDFEAESAKGNGQMGKAYGIPSPILLSLDPDLCVRIMLNGSTLWRLTYGNCQWENQITSTVCGSVSIRNIM